MHMVSVGYLEFRKKKKPLELKYMYVQYTYQY